MNHYDCNEPFLHSIKMILLCLHQDTPVRILTFSNVERFSLSTNASNFSANTKGVLAVGYDGTSGTRFWYYALRDDFHQRPTLVMTYKVIDKYNNFVVVSIKIHLFQSLNIKPLNGKNFTG